MCKSKMATTVTEPSREAPRAAARVLQSPGTRTRKPHASSSSDISSAGPTTSSDGGSSSPYLRDSWQTSSLYDIASLSTLRESLPENTHIYSFSELRTATNNFLAKRFSSSSSVACWRCTLRGKDAIVFQRKFRRRIDTPRLREMLVAICRSHHMSIIKLLGIAISDAHIYLVYEFVSGANLADCLRNPRNPDFTVLSTWISRMQIATDLAHGLDYIHNSAGVSLVHKHIKSSSVVVTEPSYSARICHFGAVELSGEATGDQAEASPLHSPSKIGEIVEEEEVHLSSPRQGEISDRGSMQFEGVRGYMSLEYQATGVATQESDVYAFGVVILELLSGEEPLKFRFDRLSATFVMTSVIETARAAVDGGEGKEGRLRRWVDRRLKDSFPVGVAEKMIRLALECVHVDPDQRPSMRRVAGKISKLYLESRLWSDTVKPPSEMTVSLAPR